MDNIDNFIVKGVFMSNVYQLNQIRELLAEVDPQSEIAVKIKEVIDSNPIDKLVKKWDSKLKNITDDQEKKNLAALLENTYIHFKEKDSSLQELATQQHKQKIADLKTKLQETLAMGNTDDSIITILESQIDILEKHDSTTPTSQEEPFPWRYVNPYDEVLKFWDCLQSARQVFGFQAMSSSSQMAYALRYIKDKNEPNEVHLMIKTKAFDIDSFTTVLLPNTKVSGELLAKILENSLFEQLFNFLKKNTTMYYPVNDGAISCPLTIKGAATSSENPANFIVANERFYETYKTKFTKLKQIVSNAIPNDHYIVGFKGSKESQAGVIIGLYQIFLQNIPIWQQDGQNKSHSFNTRFAFCSNIEGAEDYYMLCKVDPLIQTMSHINQQEVNIYKTTFDDNNLNIETETNNEDKNNNPEIINKVWDNTEIIAMEERQKILTKEKLDGIRSYLTQFNDRPLKIIKELCEFLSNGYISFDDHLQLFKEFLPDQYDAGEYITGY
jgi:hypothetical protein